jgi:hypothetical protein
MRNIENSLLRRSVKASALLLQPAGIIRALPVEVGGLLGESLVSSSVQRSTA